MILKRLFPQVILILMISFIVGLGANVSLIKKFLKGEFQHGFVSQEDYPSITFITLAEAEDYFSSSKATFVDSRPYAEFQAGRILNAVSIPYETGRVEEELTQLAIPKHRILVIYCDGDECQSSVNLAKILHHRGYTSLKVFFGGWAAWQEAGLPTQVQND